MPDTYEKDLAQKSSLTTSDFIRVVGSDNVSYKQQVSDVKDAFGVAVYHIEYAETASTSGTRYYSPSISGAIDSIATKGAGRYMVECIRSTSYSDTYSNITSSNMTLIVDVLGASYINVIGIQLNNNISAGDIILKRAKSPTWGGWIKMPTRAEVNALNNMFFDIAWKANADLNTLQTTGVYWISSGATNAPAGSWYPLLVMSKGDTIRQIAIVGNDTINSRAYQSGAWTNWIRLPSRIEMDAIGTSVTQQQSSTAVSIPASTLQTVLTATLSAGTWVVEGRIRYDDASSTGRRFVRVGNTSEITTSTRTTNCLYKTSTSPCSMCVTGVYVLSASTEMKLLGYSDVATSATDGYIRAVRIK